MVTNQNKAVYINKGEHDNPHELPKQQNIEGSTDTEHSLLTLLTVLPKSIQLINLNISSSIFKIMKRLMNQTLIMLTKN